MDRLRRWAKVKTREMQSSDEKGLNMSSCDDIESIETDSSPPPNTPRLTSRDWSSGDSDNSCCADDESIDEPQKLRKSKKTKRNVGNVRKERVCPPRPKPEKRVSSEEEVAAESYRLLDQLNICSKHDYGVCKCYRCFGMNVEEGSSDEDSEGTEIDAVGILYDVDTSIEPIEMAKSAEEEWAEKRFVRILRDFETAMAEAVNVSLEDVLLDLLNTIYNLLKKVWDHLLNCRRRRIAPMIITEIPVLCLGETKMDAGDHIVVNIEATESEPRSSQRNKKEI